MEKSRERTSVMAYRKIFEGSGFHHSKSGLQIMHDVYVNGYLMLLYDVTPDHGFS